MKKLLVLSILLTVGLFVLFGNYSTKIAKASTPANDNVTICHWDEGKNAYKPSQTVSEDSIYKWDNGKDECKTDGHGKDPKDIIPSFVNGQCTFSGLNLNKESWIANDCKESTSTPTPTPTPTPEVTPTPTPTATETPSNPGGPGDGLGCGSHDCSTHPATSSQGQVLGASTGPQVLGLSTTSGESETALSFIQLISAFGFTSLGFGLFRKHA